MRAEARAAAVAGMFYPRAPAALADDVDQRLRNASPRPPPPGAGWPKLLLVPHAGYVYSGDIAARAYATLAPGRELIGRVLLLGPTHRVALRGLAAPTSTAFHTPLGAVVVDQEALARLADLPQVVSSDAAHAQEHSLEVQLPFLQRVLQRFTLVPLAAGRATPAEVAEVLERLWGGPETLIVISSDLSHDLPYAAARERDRATIERVLQLDPALDPEQACGATPLAGALVAARRHGLQPRLLDLRNSGDTAGGRDRVVGYAALRFDPGLDSGLGDALLGLARRAIAARLDLSLPPGAALAHPALDQPGASFVTLHHHGRLRGCIGSLQARQPLRDDARLHAVAAAFDDPRFPPLTAAEWPGLEIEVSLLGAPETLPALTEAGARQALRPGVDGVVLAWRGHHATFLPQVWASLPQPADFLAALKHKAGLAADFWSPELRLSRFTVRSFQGPAQPGALS